MVELVRHRQTKGSATDRPRLNHRATPRLHTFDLQRENDWEYPCWGIPVATTNDLRRYPRFNPPKPTFSAWQSANQRFVSRVGNLGLGGLFIRTPEPPQPGTLIQLLLDTSEGEIRARGEVKSTRPKEGMGVKIVAMQQEDRARFARWLKRLSGYPNPGRDAR